MHTVTVKLPVDEWAELLDMMSLTYVLLGIRKCGSDELVHLLSAAAQARIKDRHSATMALCDISDLENAPDSADW